MSSLKNHIIGFLATGDELVYGDIANTNGQTMAQALRDAGFSLGMQLVVSDNEKAIESGLEFLLNQHDIIIITGGLGPTSDDRTRFAVAKIIHETLELNDFSWTSIQNRLNKMNIAPSAHHKQQALFPKSAIILENKNGSANGCRLHYNNKIIFLLPGPPHECLPIFHEEILTFLIKNYLSTKLFHHKWRLFGVIEGDLAAHLDNLLKTYNCQTAYRWNYPYLDFKVRSNSATDLQNIIDFLNPELIPHCICPAETTAYNILKENLINRDIKIYLNDYVTNGYIEHKYSMIINKDLFNFNESPNKILKTNEIVLSLSGTPLHQLEQVSVQKYTISIKGQHLEKTLEKELIARNPMIAHALLEWLSSIIYNENHSVTNIS